jgi:DNA mismatch endonuclease (patch repair protein)
MRTNRHRDTAPERALRSKLHRTGLRFRVNHPIAVAGRTVRPDIVFTRARLAVFIDGCFWHRCPNHATNPTANAAYWSAKLTANVERDRRITVAMRSEGWTVLRLWEHQSPEHGCHQVICALEGCSAAVANGQ